MMKSIRIGVIGCGYWGPNLIRNFVSLTGSEVVIVADKRPERLHHIQSLYPRIQITEDYHQIFSLSLDAVVVATPPATHFTIAKDCLDNGLHTFIEKPMALSSQDCMELIDLAEQEHLTLMVGHTYEYNPAVLKVKEMIDTGDIGEIYYINMVRVNLGLFQSDSNVIWDLAPHDISILLYLLDQFPLSVQAIGEDCIFNDKHDLAFMHLEFPDQVSAHLHLSWLDPRKIRRITIVGSHKMLVYDDIESMEKIKIYDKGVEIPPYTDTFADFQCSYHYGDVVIPYIQFTEPLRVECQHFLDCINDGDQQPISSGNQGLQVVQILEAAERSLCNKGQRQLLISEDHLVTGRVSAEQIVGD
jgi:predicted dehydrogenase